MRRIGSITTLVFAALLATVALSPAAVAVPPVRETNSYEPPPFEQSCDYGALQVSFVVQLDVVQFFDRRGNPTRVHVHGSDVATVTNPANGETVRGVDHWLEIDILLTGETTIVGLYYHLNFPGAGIVLHESGRIVYDADRKVVHLSGPHDVVEGDFSALCDALA